MKMKIYLGILLNSILLISSKIYNLGEGDIYLPYPEPRDGWDVGEYCKSKNLQSPIEIPSMKDEHVKKDNGSKAQIIELLYTKISNTKVEFKHGHKWTTPDLDLGKIKIKLNETLFIYNLTSFHFHLYSEHRLESKQYPMELHLVHKNVNDSDTENENLVLAILFDYADDKVNKFLNDIHLSNESKTITEASISDLIKKDDTFYYYKGSLTTEPCTEHVNWIVFKDIKPMSYELYENFKDWVEGSKREYYGNGYGNARGPKPLNGREIYLENEKELESSKNNFLVISMVSIWIYFLLILY